MNKGDKYYDGNDSIVKSNSILGVRIIKKVIQMASMA